MKNEKGNLTITQLEKKKRLAMLLGIVGTIVLVIIAITIVTTVKINVVNNSQYLGIVFLIISIFPIFISQILTEEYDKQIDLKEKEIRVKVIKKIAKEGTLKELVTLKKEDTIKNILLAGIKEVVIRKNELQSNSKLEKYEEYAVSIYLENGYEIGFLKLSNEKFLDLINPKIKERILELLISNITICSEEKGNIKLKITGKDFLYEESIVNDDELLDTFELKE